MKPPSICELILASVALTFAIPALATPQPRNSSAEAPEISWPQTPRPAMTATGHHTTFDGIQVPMLSIRGGTLAFELSKRAGLALVHSNSARYSGELIDERIPGVSIGLSLFNTKEFLPDLSETSWAAYKMGLTNDRSDIKIVFENSNIESPTTPYVFGKQFRQIAYEQQVGDNSVKRREIFAFVGDQLLVFTISGTKDSIDKHWFSVENLLGEMSLI